MKRPKLAGVFLFVGFLLVYLMFVKRHYDTFQPGAYRQPPHHRLTDNDMSVSAAGPSYQYGIMFDAGSTGTRIHIFKFQIENKESPKLAHETFRAIKPGLSAYADDPEKCTSGIMELLEVAKSSIPSYLWNATPVVLKATAGLRLLPGEKANHLLDQVRMVFLESPFLFRDASVSIMEGTDEGISAWITVNFLTGGLHSTNLPTVGILDLGGGSTQITFSPQDERTIQTSPIDYIRSFQIFNNIHTVYTHSYLGLGLMSARLAILGGVDASPQEKRGGAITVADYIDGAKRVCSGLSISPLQGPFLCLDLVYISVLLQELGFPSHKQFKLARTINQVETSWALGATFHYIESLKRH
ncbi:ectonucleoside triphosphate diphosphohydrolase 6 isoform X2 [Channa argus]|uniref:ectonucleoside triphosphate diphosphohydrolase 6 isoform X2 n=1 Tax=Channa argus TaxID=215402 RepID=UPI0035206F83